MAKKIIIGSSKITRQSQITIPKAVREMFDFKEGDQVFFVVEEDGRRKLLLMKGPIILE